MRPHIAAVYAFARTADDFADEGDLPIAERYAQLDAWVARLRTVVRAGTPVPEASRRCSGPSATRIHECRPATSSLFEDLVSAFRQDVETTRYGTWDDCARLLPPIGQPGRAAGARALPACAEPAAERASDAVCTALQLTNFWQDLAIDWSRGRLYVPADVSRAFGAAEADLGRRRW